MVDRFVARRALHAANDCIGGIVSVGGSGLVIGAAEVAIDRFTHDGRQGHAPPPGLVPELPVGRLVEAEVRGDISSHHDMTISR